MFQSSIYLFFCVEFESDKHFNWTLWNVLSQLTTTIDNNFFHSVSQSASYVLHSFSTSVYSYFALLGPSLPIVLSLSLNVGLSSLTFLVASLFYKRSLSLSFYSYCLLNFLLSLSLSLYRFASSLFFTCVFCVKERVGVSTTWASPPSAFLHNFCQSQNRNLSGQWKDFEIFVSSSPENNGDNGFFT